MSFKDKKAVALATVNLAATIGIIAILILYVVLGVIVKNFDVGTKEVDEKLARSETLKSHLEVSFTDLEKLVRIKKRLSEGMALDQALQEVDWDVEE